MELHYVGLGTLFLFLLFTAVVLGGLYLLYTAMRILSHGFHKKTGRNIFYPLYFVTAFPILMILYRQSVSMGLLTYSNPEFKLYVEITTLSIPLFSCLILLFYILKKTPDCLKP